MSNQPPSPLTAPQSPAPFIISVSSRALFNLEAENKIFVEQGEAAFEEWQTKHRKDLLKPGPAFAMIRKLLDINTRLPAGARPFKVVLMSRNSSETGMRVLKAVEHYKLPIETTVFTSGQSVSKYLIAAKVDLMLSSNPEEVRKAVERGMEAAEIVPHEVTEEDSDGKIRLAFDGDAVLFGDEAERIFKEQGLQGFRDHEVQHAERPLPVGPLAGLLRVIHAVQVLFPNKDECPFRTALVTARGLQAMERPINTLSDWGIRVDETISCGGDEKGPFLKAFGADLFFDDSRRNVESSINYQVPGAHVPFGVRNEAGAVERDFTGGTAEVTSGASEPVQTAVRRGRKP
jgi:5'-nucleotidase